MRRAPKVVQAAAIIKLSLTDENYQDHRELKERLGDRNLSPRLFTDAVRKIRDTYGANALVTVQEGRRKLYALDPEAHEISADVNEQSRRSLTENEHTLQKLEWSVKTYGPSRSLRRAIRSLKTANAELFELIEETTL